MFLMRSRQTFFSCLAVVAGLVLGSPAPSGAATLLTGWGSSSLGVIADGTSNTLAVGEVYDGHLGTNTNIWSVGSRHNSSLRTTENPINTAPGTGIVYGSGSSALNGAFMSRHTGGANFLLADGSVRFLNQNVDITQYRYASTIRGGEVSSLN